MQGSRILAILLLICAVHCRPNNKDDEYNYDEEKPDGFQNDNTNVAYDYEEGDDDEHPDNGAQLTPMITTIGQEFRSKANQTVHLSCEIENGERLVTIWKKNGEPIFQDTIKFNGVSNIFEVDNLPKNKTLIIHNVGANETANYTCSFPLNKNEVLEVTHRLFVETAPKIVSIKAAHDIHQLDQGKTLVLTCKAIGFPAPVIKWSRKGIRLMEEGETVTIENVSHMDAGDYQCLADNSIEPPAHDSIHIMVTHKPVVKIEKLSVNSETNLDSELICHVQGVPKPEVLWMKDGINVVVGKRHNFRNINRTHILQISNLQKEDFGVYTCYAKNRIGKTEVNVTLTAYPSTPMVQFNHHSHNKSMIGWVLESKSPITKYMLEFKKLKDSNWQSKSLEVLNGDSNIYSTNYTFANLETGHKYEARLKAQNTYGWSEYSVPIEFVVAHDHHKALNAQHATEELSHQTLSPNKNEVLSSEFPQDPKLTAVNESHKGIPQESYEMAQNSHDHQEPRQAAKEGSPGAAAALLPVLSLIYMSILTTILSH